MKANELADALHGHTGPVGHDTQGGLYVPVYNSAKGISQWVKIGSTMPLNYGVPDMNPSRQSSEEPE
jgi:hypothetical protein